VQRGKEGKKVFKAPVNNAPGVIVTLTEITLLSGCIFSKRARRKKWLSSDVTQQSCKKIAQRNQVCKTHSHKRAHMQWAKEQHTKECNAHGWEKRKKSGSVHVIRAKQRVYTQL
jgi:hypothetical protein